MEKKNGISLKNFFISLSNLLDIGEACLVNHQIRTAFIAWQIAEKLNLNKNDLNKLIIASLIHDIGAISLEEKVSVHNFAFEELDTHAYRGFYILQKIEGFEEIALAVRYHHRSYLELGDENFLAQIINLSDSIERAIDRDKEIPEQKENIINSHKSSLDFHPKILKEFLEISVSEKFWEDLINPRIKEFFYGAPICNECISWELSTELSFLVRDIIDFKSPFTLRHSLGVMFCAEELGKKLEFSREKIDELVISALLHDVGKLIIPSSIIMKPSTLDREEKLKMEEHPYYTYLFLKEAGYSDNICKAASYHHEELNGRGYPFRISRENIPLEARVIAVSDVFVSLYEERPYRESFSKEIIFGMMDNFTKYKLDKSLVELLLNDYELFDKKLSEMKEQLEKEYKLFNEIEKGYTDE